MMFPSALRDTNTDNVAVFLARKSGAYQPVAFSYGTKILPRKQADHLLRYVAEFVASEKFPNTERENYRAEWAVRMIENQTMRWDGAASWVNYEKPGEALKNAPPQLA